MSLSSSPSASSIIRPNRREFLRALSGLGLVTAGLTLPACGTKREAPRNVLLIVADTLRADRLGCYGYDRPTTPHVDRLAEEGARSLNHYTVAPSTLASFASIFTSRHPKDHGAFRNGFPPREELPRLAEVFRDAGFETAMFVASFCLTRPFGLARGFDHFDETLTHGTPLRDNKTVRNAAEVSQAFIKWLNHRDGGRPFFAALHYFDPHWPYDPPLNAKKPFGAVKGGPPPSGRPSFIEAQHRLRAAGGKPDDYVRNLHDLYCAEIRYMDGFIGRALKRLEVLGLDEDTLVVFTSDHGETFWDHDDYFNHGLMVYDLHDPGASRGPLSGKDPRGA